MGSVALRPQRRHPKLRGAFLITAEDERAASAFMETEDFRNAVRAFAEKRPPVFQEH
jgi:enoyl-CoA hydratase/carnithine racemase